MYTVIIIDGAGDGESLERYLNERAQLGYEVRFMLPNGVNRWTVVCWVPVLKETAHVS